MAELKIGGGQRREDASQHYLGFMEVKMSNKPNAFSTIYIHRDNLNEVHACAKFLPFKLVVSLHGCLADVTMDYVSQQDELKNLR